MKLIVDTNILVRLVTLDDLDQEEIAKRVMREAEFVAIPLIALCELVWVLRRAYNFSHAKIAFALRILISADNLEFDRSAVESGLTMLDAGGDFADGVIAHEGRWLGGETFVSFDKTAIDLLKVQGHSALLL